MNYKNTGREYTWDDLVGFNLYLSVGDSYKFNNHVYIVTNDGQMDILNEHITQYGHRRSLIHCKQLDEYLAKQESYVAYWTYGDRCIYKGNEATFIGYSKAKPSTAVIECIKDCFSIIDRVYANDLSKPLTEQQKKEQERDKKIEGACLSFRHDFGLLSIEDQSKLKFEANEWLKSFEKNGFIVDKTGYKGE